MIKAEWTNKDSLDLQPTCNQLATTEGYIIRRQHVLDAIDYIGEDEGLGMVDLKKIVESLPSAEQKTGEWKVKRWRNRWMRKCSVCGWMQEIDTPKMQGWVYKYCPNCGAMMHKGGDSE